MKVSKIMANIVQMVARDDSLYEAAKTMKKRHWMSFGWCT